MGLSKVKVLCIVVYVSYHTQASFMCVSLSSNLERV